MENINKTEHSEEVLAIIEEDRDLIDCNTHNKKEVNEMDRAHAYRKLAAKNG